MKRILAIIAIYINSALLVYSQKHLEFLDCPITGPMKEFVAQMQQKGLTKSYSKGWFKQMKTKYLKGNFWYFTNCDVVIREFKDIDNVTSVYIHPQNNFLLLEDLIESLDGKYGQHRVQYFNSDVNAVNFDWSVPEGQITIYASTIYGQAFDIIYRDYIEVKLLNISEDRINNDL